MGQPLHKDAFEAIHSAAKALHSVGVIDKETLDDMTGGIAEAEEMQKNLQHYGTIDVPAEVTREAIAELEAGNGTRVSTVTELMVDLETEVPAEEAEKLRRQNLVNEAMADGRKLVTVREISEINDIPGADLIKVASVEGWKVVVKAGEFQPGDKCVFFEVDSYLPMDDERYKFLEKNATNWQNIPGARLKTIRLRKQLSQGLALPVAMFPEVQPFLESEELRDINFTGALGIMKWEKIINAQLAGMAKGSFPSFLRKSDQERCQNMGAAIFGYDVTYSPIDLTGIPADAIVAMEKKGELAYIALGPADQARMYRVKQPTASRDTRYEVSLKMDGSSMTVYCRLGDAADASEVGVCSRNLDLKLEGNEDNSFVKIAQEGMLEQLEAYCKQTGRSFAVQGELMGPGIQGNREALKVNTFYVYNIFDIGSGEFLTPTERWEVLAEMNSLADAGIGKYFQHVPILHTNVTLAELGITNMDELLKFAEGPSMVNNVREGVVFKEVEGNQQFKAISNLYLEQEK